MTIQTDIAILGGGPGGYVAAQPSGGERDAGLAGDTSAQGNHRPASRAAWPDKSLWSNINVGLYALPPDELRKEKWT